MSGPTGARPGHQPLHVVQLFGDGGATTALHVRSLAAGLVARGLRVTVGAPAGAVRRYGFPAAGSEFTALPAQRRTEAVRRIRQLCAPADLVHAHGIRAGLAAALALRGRRTPLVITWHGERGRPLGSESTLRLRRLTEGWVVRAAAVVLGATSDLVDRARRRGARDARLAPVALPVPHPAKDPAERDADAQKVRAELGAVDRPLLLAVGPLEHGSGHRQLLTAAQGWRRRIPRPLLAIAGEGSQREALERRIAREDLPVRLLGRRDDLPGLLAAADVAVLVEGWDNRSLLAQGALRGGVPLVATAVGPVPELTGDAAVLVPEGDPVALAEAVSHLLADPDRRASLVAAGRQRTAAWPTEDRTVAHVLAVYDELVPPLRG